MRPNAKVEFGDFQTPLALAKEICGMVRRQGFVPEFVLEPTCGVGAFLVAAAEIFPRATLRGSDINRDHIEQAEAELAFFSTPPREQIRPPWDAQRVGFKAAGRTGGRVNEPAKN